MKHKVGDIVRLKDDGDTDFIVVTTKESRNTKILRSGFDYLVKRNNTLKIEGEYSRSVFKENVYGQG